MNQADCFEAFGYVRAAVCYFIEHTQCLEVVCRISEEAAISEGAGRAVRRHIRRILLCGHHWLRIHDHFMAATA